MTTPTSTALAIPKAFLWRRLHSIAGLWLVIFIISHLFTNSQAALLIGDDGQGFINAVNAIHNLPYLPLIEIAVGGRASPHPSFLGTEVYPHCRI